jgi:putative redox protein
MAQVKAKIAQEQYQVKIEANGNTLIADEPIDEGGLNQGFNPNELLAASLAACTSITLRMYSNHKKWNLEEIRVEINLSWDKTTSKTTINRNIELIGNLDDVQRTRLLAVANACPVHKILSNSFEINSAITN